MCRIMVLKGVQDSALALDFMKAVAPVMSIGNNDGIGYSAINSQNKLFSEKWHDNKQFLDTKQVIDKQTLVELEPYKEKLPYLSLNYEKQGEITLDDITTVTMHTRFATCGKEFANTHPFVDQGISLIHNGGISNAYALNLNKISTCDSENALQLYINESLNLKTEIDSFQTFTDQLKGYWAFAFLAKDTNGIYMLDIVRDRAQLYWADLPELGKDCTVFATTSEIIDAGVKALGLPKRKEIYSLPEHYYSRFNAISGDFVLDHKLTESVLNKYIPPKSYNYNKKSFFGDDYYEDEYGYYNYGKKPTLVEDKTTLVEEIYEGFKSKEDDISDDILIESFYDTGTLLLDRLYDYDMLMSTSYGNSYEDLPIKVKAFIEMKEEDDYIIFDTVLEMIESYQKTKTTASIAKIYKLKKRA